MNATLERVIVHQEQQHAQIQLEVLLVFVFLDILEMVFIVMVIIFFVSFYLIFLWFF